MNIHPHTCYITPVVHISKITQYYNILSQVWNIGFEKSVIFPHLADSQLLHLGQYYNYKNDNIDIIFVVYTSSNCSL